jgi:hypothetical protein
MADGVLQVLEGSGPTIAGGERREPPMQASGRGPGEQRSLFTLTVEAESGSASGRGALTGAEDAVS